jgi:hypothetical protein
MTEEERGRERERERESKRGRERESLSYHRPSHLAILEGLPTS